jgi:hypothetical protein
MLYTISGGFFGFLVALIVAKVLGFSFESSGGKPSFPGGGSVFVFFGTLMGACIGFGIGVARLSGGNYLPFQ